MRMLSLLLVVLVTACGPRPGTARAHGAGPDFEFDLASTARGGSCLSSRVVMVEAAEDDRVVGVVWRYDSLVAGTFPIATPAAPESVSTGAAVAARYVHLDEVRGYRAVSGAWRVTKVDSTTLSGTVDGTLQRVGEADTVHFTASFERVPLTGDTTICRS